jgi:hypothetical protein
VRSGAETCARWRVRQVPFAAALGPGLGVRRSHMHIAPRSR